MPESPDPPPRYELKKYQAGYGLLVIAVFVVAFAYLFDLWPAYLIVAFLVGAGIAFQFDKERPSRHKHRATDEDA